MKVLISLQQNKLICSFEPLTEELVNVSTSVCYSAGNYSCAVHYVDIRLGLVLLLLQSGSYFDMFGF